MTAHVLDTSVTVAWYLPERFAEAARRWHSRLFAGDVEFHVPGFHYWEFANVLRTYIRRGTIQESLAAQIWSVHLTAPLRVIEPPTAEVLNTALEYDTTAYDAVYIALALHLDMPLLTAERPTTPWVRKLGKRVQYVR